jgi:hypothetical protein
MPYVPNGTKGHKTKKRTLREEQRLRMFENWVVRRISGRNKDEVTRKWRKLHYEELHILYSSPNITMQMKQRQ